MVVGLNTGKDWLAIILVRVPTIMVSIWWERPTLVSRVVKILRQLMMWMAADVLGQIAAQADAD